MKWIGEAELQELKPGFAFGPCLFCRKETGTVPCVTLGGNADRCCKNCFFRSVALTGTTV